jgi:cyclin C
MAASFWESSQSRCWTFTKEELEQMRDALQEEDQALAQMFPLPDWKHINIFLNMQINRLAKRMNIRQQCVATGQMYLKRFYTKVGIRRTNPYLVVSTALYLACKMEESPQHIRMVVTEARSLWPDHLATDVARIGECEFFLISEMNSQLIIHQPYRTLSKLQSTFFLTPDEVSLAWSIINDHYITDLPLLYPPHIIALTAMLLCLVFRPNSVAGSSAATNMAAATAALAQAQAQIGRAMPMPGVASGQTTPGGGAPDKDKQQEARVGKIQRFAAWLAESEVNIEDMVDCTQELVSYYEVNEQYNDKATRDQINRYVKARGLDKP